VPAQLRRVLPILLSVGSLGLVLTVLLGTAALIVVGAFLFFVLEKGTLGWLDALFQSVTARTAGFNTVGIAGLHTSTLFLLIVLMIIGAAPGSTGGGVKVMRIGVLLKVVHRQIRRVVTGRRTVNLLLIDGERIELEEIRRIAGLFFAWVVLLAIGAAVTALLSTLGPMEAASGMFSALGNIGPCYIPVAQMTQLHPLVKLTYIIGMLAGRLEILPILMLFSRYTWR